MHLITRCYLEITNVCNLSCVFCPKNARPKRMMTLQEYDVLTDKLKGCIKFLYFHLMGEPMLHPDLGRMIGMAREKGFVPILTTNGTLLDRAPEELPHKVQISLHSQEANTHGTGMTQDQAEEQYMHRVMDWSLKAAERGAIVVLRLWNQGGFDTRNDRLHELIGRHIDRQQWIQRYDGWKLAERIYLEYDQMFEWPEEQRSALNEDEVFCYALRNQIGVLVDGTVVPCCLDHEGVMALGNLHRQSLDEILESSRARALYDGFSLHKATEPLCQRCDYAAVTKRFRK